MVWIKRISLSLLALIVVVILVAVIALLHFRIPQNATGMAAQGVCSATFVAGRNSGQDVFAEDLKPASPAFDLVSTSINQDQRSVTAKFLGVFERRASLLNNRGCVLDEPPQSGAQPFVNKATNSAAWPKGDSAVPPAAAGPGVDDRRLQGVADAAMAGAGDPNGVNARGLAVVQNGKLLALREAKGFENGTPLLGWSMTKTVAAMLYYKRAAEVGLDLQRPVVSAFPAGHEPAWVNEWKQDNRRSITVADMIFMRSGLKISESYEPWGDVVQMLYGAPSMADWAANHPLAHDPGSFWYYTSGGANLLSEITQGQFASNAAYWDYPKQALFDPIGVTSATMETDTSGTWVGSSYLWASVADWARLGQLMLADGKWGDKQVLPPGWLKLASTPALPTGDGHGYGAQTWLAGAKDGGECNTNAGVPTDTMTMDGHWGQVVAMIPSRNAVIVRLGWTVDEDKFDECKFISDVLATLPK